MSTLTELEFHDQFPEEEDAKARPKLPSMQEQRKILHDMKAGKIQFNDLSEILRKDYIFVLGAVRINGLLLKECAELLRNPVTGKEIAGRAVYQNGLALEFVSGALLQDRDIIFQAIERDPLSLQFVPPSFVEYEKAILEAVRKKPEAFRFVPREIEGYRNILLKAIKKNYRVFMQAPPEIQQERSFILLALEQNPALFEHLPLELTGDPEFFLDAVNKNGLVLQYHTKTLKTSPEILFTIVLAAVQKNGLALEWAPSDLKADINIVGPAMEQNVAAQAFADPSVKKTFPQEWINKLYREANERYGVNPDWNPNDPNWLKPRRRRFPY